MLKRRAKDLLKKLKDETFCFYEIMDTFSKNEIPEKLRFYLEKHIQGCEKCRLKYNSMREFGAVKEELNLSGDYNLYEAVFKDKKAISIAYKDEKKVREGEIWLVDGYPEPLIDGLNKYYYSNYDRLVYIRRVGKETVVGFPINKDYLPFVTNMDILISEEQSSLSLPFAIELWNGVEMKKSSLLSYVGEIKEELIDEINTYYEKLLKEGDKAETVLPVGTALSENDIRLEFMEVEKEATKFIEYGLGIEELVAEEEAEEENVLDYLKEKVSDFFNVVADIFKNVYAPAPGLVSTPLYMQLKTVPVRGREKKVSEFDVEESYKIILESYAKEEAVEISFEVKDTFTDENLEGVGLNFYELSLDKEIEEKLKKGETDLKEEDIVFNERPSLTVKSEDFPIKFELKKGVYVAIFDFNGKVREGKFVKIINFND